jgi:hypothetical protein
MRTVALILVASALAVSGCGGSSATSTVSETTHNLAKIHSGVLDLKLLVTPRSGDPFGFELKGPFALRAGKLPVARIVYTQTANGSSATATLASDGKRGWIIANGTTTPLTDAQAATLLSGTQALEGGEGGLSRFDVASWIEDPQQSDGGEVGDAETDRVTGKLDVVAAANDLMGFAALAGREGSQIEGADADRLREATRSSSVDLFTGKDDRLLRKLTLSADLGFDVPQSLKRALGTTVGAKIDFLLAVDRPNAPVRVKGP